MSVGTLSKATEDAIYNTKSIITRQTSTSGSYIDVDLQADKPYIFSFVGSGTATVYYATADGVIKLNASHTISTNNSTVTKTFTVNVKKLFITGYDGVVSISEWVDASGFSFMSGTKIQPTVTGESPSNSTISATSSFVKRPDFQTPIPGMTAYSNGVYLFGNAQSKTTIQYVGGKSAQVEPSASNNTTVSLTDLTGGTDSSPKTGDMVLAIYAIGASTYTFNPDVTIVSSGYTESDENYYGSQNASGSVNYAIYYKFMGGTPDTEIIFGPTTTPLAAGAVTIQVYRGVNSSTPFDVAPTVGKNSATTNTISNTSVTPITTTTYGAETISCLVYYAYNGYSESTMMVSNQYLNYQISTGSSLGKPGIGIYVGVISTGAPGTLDYSGFSNTGSVNPISGSTPYTTVQFSLKPSATVTAANTLNKYLVSSDLATYTEATFPGSLNVSTIASISPIKDGFALFPLASGSTYYTSTDGINWTTRNLPAVAAWKSMASDTDGTNYFAVTNTPLFNSNGRVICTTGFINTINNASTTVPASPTISADSTTWAFTSTSMALRPANGVQFVGAKNTTGTSSAALTLTLGSGLTGGIDTGVRTGDLVVASFSVSSTTNRAMALSSSGWTTVADLFQTDTNSTNLGVFYKIMGATPDTDVTTVGFGGAGEGTTLAIAVYRGVNQTTPLDVTSTTAIKASAFLVDPPAITPITSGARVIVAGAASHTNGTLAYSAYSTGFTAATYAAVNAATFDASNAILHSNTIWTSGAVDPSAWTSATGDSTSNSHAAVTMALRPASTTEIAYVGDKVVDLQTSAVFNTTISLTDLSNGIASAPIEGDVVIVTYTLGALTGDINISPPTGYTEISDLYSSDTYSVNSGVFYKIMSSTPDTSVTIVSPATGTDGAVVSINVFRYVDVVTGPFDISHVTNTNPSTAIPTFSNPIPPSPGAKLFVSASASTRASSPTYTMPGTYAKTSQIGTTIPSTNLGLGAYISSLSSTPSLSNIGTGTKIKYNDSDSSFYIVGEVTTTYKSPTTLYSTTAWTGYSTTATYSDFVVNSNYMYAIQPIVGNIGVFATNNPATTVNTGTSRLYEDIAINGSYVYFLTSSREIGYTSSANSTANITFLSGQYDFLVSTATSSISGTTVIGDLSSVNNVKTSTGTQVPNTSVFPYLAPESIASSSIEILDSAYFVATSKYHGIAKAKNELYLGLTSSDGHVWNVSTPLFLSNKNFSLGIDSILATSAHTYLYKKRGGSGTISNIVYTSNFTSFSTISLSNSFSSDSISTQPEILKESASPLYVYGNSTNAAGKISVVNGSTVSTVTIPVVGSAKIVSYNGYSAFMDDDTYYSSMTAAPQSLQSGLTGKSWKNGFSITSAIQTMFQSVSSATYAYSTNSGATWNEGTLPVAMDSPQLFRLSNNGVTLYAVVDHANICVTTDAVNWVYSELPSNLSPVNYNSANIGLGPGTSTARQIYAVDNYRISTNLDTRRYVDHLYLELI